MVEVQQYTVVVMTVLTEGVAMDLYIDQQESTRQQEATVCIVQ